ncbi:hypothetical protein SELMODRAFT_422367 [Selaginella moellendorffii]|uniref:Uncharacterized protein n=1 Tax=Selaginella moellendorffii TaxID=88036 RepID=D8SI64_SELML|nr:hypothetical protein SELMODRAFT_422367 [Selaginella moellendorffii]
MGFHGPELREMGRLLLFEALRICDPTSRSGRGLATKSGGKKGKSRSRSPPSGKGKKKSARNPQEKRMIIGPNEEEMKKKKIPHAKESWWIRDPKTGFWVPEGYVASRYKGQVIPPNKEKIPNDPTWWMPTDRPPVQTMR